MDNFSVGNISMIYKTLKIKLNEIRPSKSNIFLKNDSFELFFIFGKSYEFFQA